MSDLKARKRDTISSRELEKLLDILKIQNSLRQSNIMCDVILLADDGVKIPAHKIILASSSQYFMSMFNTDFKEKYLSIVPIKEIDSNILETVINYIYTLKIVITENNMSKLLKAIHLFDLEIVINKCCNYIQNNLNLGNCIKFMKLSKLFSFYKLYDFSFSYALDNFYKLDVYILMDLSYEEVISFISNNNLAIKSEDQVFQFVLDWVKFDEENRKEYLPELIKHLRLTFISKKFLVNVLKEPFLKDISILENIIIHLSNPEYYANMNGLSNNKQIRRYQSWNTPDLVIAIDNNRNDINYINISDSTLMWKPGPKILLPPNSIGSRIVVLDNAFLYSIGGILPSKDVYTLDLTNINKHWIQTSSMIFCRLNFAICVNENRIFVVGGRGGNSKDDNFTLDTIEVFDKKTQKWSIFCIMDDPRYHCSAIYYNNFLYVIGGIDYNGDTLSSIECYDERTLNWKNYINPLPQKIHSTCVIIFKNELYIIGGNAWDANSRNSHVSLRTVFKCKLQQNSSWLTLPTLLKNPRHNACTAVINENVYIFGGLYKDIILQKNNNTTIGNKLRETTEVFQPANGIISNHDLKLGYGLQNVIMLNMQLLNLLDVKIF